MKQPDIVLIGGGIMSATLAALYHELYPDAKIVIFERLKSVAQESSDSWNNAGTGHSGFCELNYTPEQPDGSIKIDKAIKVAEQFELSKQLWTYLLEKGKLDSEHLFLHQVPHCSLVFGEKNVEFLKKRVEKMTQNPLFKGMEFSEDINQLKEWFPLVMEGKNLDMPIAASKMSIGTDVNFGLLTRQLFSYLRKKDNIHIHLEHNVFDIDRNPDGSWKIEYKYLKTNKKEELNTPYVFVGAGGGALRLLNKAEIHEVDGYGGFPIGGKWLKCINLKIKKMHHAKVYGLAEISAPPMSVPHLDSRVIAGRDELLFGPYAGFSTKFLKHGSYFDLPESLDFDNILPMIQVGFDNIPLTRYLVEQVMMNFDDKFKELQKYYPNAVKADWELVNAGQRVQIIKKNKEGDGILEFGTEVVVTQDGTLSGILGASPGASTAASIMLDVFEKMFPNELEKEDIITKLKEIFPSYHLSLSEHPEVLRDIRTRCHKVLKIE